MSAQRQPAPSLPDALPTKLAAGKLGAGGNRPRACRQPIVGGAVSPL
jgi:hypothetical protein